MDIDVGHVLMVILTINLIIFAFEVATGGKS